MRHKRINFITILLFVLGLSGLKAQNLDRVALSSGGISSDSLNATIGEIFVFSISSGGISLDAGSQSDTTNSGGIPTASISVSTVACALVFPNPVGDFLNLQINGLDETTIVFSIFDGAGRLMLQNNVAPANRVYTLRVSTLAAGNYFLRGINAKGKVFESIQFVKQ